MGLMKDILTPTFGGNWGAARGEVAQTIETHGDGDITVTTYQNVDGILAANRALQNADNYDGKFQEEDWGQRVARVPKLLIYRWVREGKIKYGAPDMMQRILQLLDDPEYSHLKVVPHKVSRGRPKRAYMRASSSAPEILPAFKMPGERDDA